MDLLCWTLGEDAVLEENGPVQLLLPDPLPGHRTARSRHGFARHGGHRGPDAAPGLAA